MKIVVLPPIPSNNNNPGFPQPAFSMARQVATNNAILAIAFLFGGVVFVPLHLLAQSESDREKLFQETLLPFIEEHCYDCHAGGSAEGDYDLEIYQNLSDISEGREELKKALQRINFGDMPPPDEANLPKAERQKFIAAFDEILNQVDCTKGTDPGQVTIRRLNRNEYRNTIRDLIGVEYKPANEFPGDDVGYGFDNIGDVLSLPPILMEKYLKAAEEITSHAIVTKGLGPKIDEVVEGAKMNGSGSGRGRGARVLATSGESYVRFTLPESGHYEVSYEVYADQAGDELAKMELTIDRKTIRNSSVRGTSGKPNKFSIKEKLDKGVQRIGIKFTNDFYDPKNQNPNRRDRNLYIKSLSVRGPLGDPRDLPETHRRIIFIQPDGEIKETQAAEQILRRLASRAFRRPATDAEIRRLLRLVQLAKVNGDNFETGIQLALQAILVSPHFLFKVEKPVTAGKTRDLSQFELATSMSYFLWSTMPDDELFKQAFENKLNSHDQLRRQIKRLLADRRSTELVSNFAGQWLQLRNLEDTSIDKSLFPNFNDDLAKSMRIETELFVWDLVQKDASILKLLDADFTFVDRRLAKHYGVKADFDNKKPDEFVRVSLADTKRGGLLTQASILTLTSNPTRTSPVKRGRWVLENLLNMPPPPPAPDAMELEAQKQLKGTLRERLQMHRENPSCASCHAKMDPIGFALEHFNAIGQWRETDDGQPIDASGELEDGSKFDGALTLQKLILTEQQDQFVRCVVEKMLTFALGRGIEYHDRCAVDKIVEHLKKNDFRISELVFAVVTSEPFQRRKGKP